MAMKKCPNCGRTYSSIVKTCPKCNVSLDGGAVAPAPKVQTPTPTVESKPVQQNTNYNSNQQTYTPPDQTYTQNNNSAKTSLFSFEGRLNRAPYIKYTFIIVAIAGLLSFGLPFVLGLNGMMIVLMLPYIEVMLKVPFKVRRVHDLGYPGWYSLLAIIPELVFVNTNNKLAFAVAILVSLYLMCQKGTEGPNQYGPDPLQ